MKKKYKVTQQQLTIFESTKKGTEKLIVSFPVKHFNIKDHEKSKTY